MLNLHIHNSEELFLIVLYKNKKMINNIWQGQKLTPLALATVAAVAAPLYLS
jgi:hypothetical protein